MTKRDYERIADALKRAYWQTGERDSITYATYVRSMAETLYADNNAFNPSKFYTACGLKGGEA